MNNDDWLEVVLAADSPEEAERFEEAFWVAGALSVTLTSQNEDIILIEPYPGEIVQWDQAFVTGLFAQGADLSEVLNSLHHFIGLDALPLVKSNKLEDKEWETEWKQHFKPILFGDKLWVCPSHETIPEGAAADSQVIFLDPGLAFGTGTHPTTAMVLSWLGERRLDEQVVVDYGCGSGILGIGSIKQGARFCVLNDIDEKAVTVTQENLEKNNVSEYCSVSLPSGTLNELLDNTGKCTADITIANILLEPLLNLRDELLSLTKPSGTILLTGLLNQQVSSVLNHYGDRIENVSVRETGDWSLIAAKKTS